MPIDLQKGKKTFQSNFILILLPAACLGLLCLEDIREDVALYVGDEEGHVGPGLPHCVPHLQGWKKPGFFFNPTQCFFCFFVFFCVFFCFFIYLLPRRESF